MKKTKFIILFIFVLLMCGCSSEEKVEGINNSLYKTDGLSHLSCTKNAEVEDDNTTVSIHYDLYYDKDEYLKILRSEESIKSTNKEILNTYEKAYNDVYSVYKGIKYYDNVVKREDGSVTSITYINYGKVDIDQVMEIEGEEDNVTVTDGKIKLSDWKSFAKRYGTTCNNNS